MALESALRGGELWHGPSRLLYLHQVASVPESVHLRIVSGVYPFTTDCVDTSQGLLREFQGIIQQLCIMWYMTIKEDLCIKIL